MYYAQNQFADYIEHIFYLQCMIVGLTCFVIGPKHTNLVSVLPQYKQISLPLFNHHVYTCSVTMCIDNNPIPKSEETKQKKNFQCTSKESSAQYNHSYYLSRAFELQTIRITNISHNTPPLTLEPALLSIYCCEILP